MAFLAGVLGRVHASPSPEPTASAASIANVAGLRTWWHSAAEVNTKTPVKDENVRQSGIYSVQIGIKSGDVESMCKNGTFYDSFVYNVIPANGMEDQKQYASNYNQDQSWSSFLYSTNVVIKITRSSKKTSPVVIRPTKLNFPVTDDGESIFITVPYSAHGHRFSVEFDDNLIPLPPSNALEPSNALLIFASPFEDPSIVPTPSESVVYPAQGRVTGLNTTKASTVYFAPGVYYLTGTDHMRLSPSVNWVYFAPGAYVKGAVEFHSTASAVKATGHGVLSGEQYLWYADPALGYKKPDDANNNGVRMWSGNNGRNKQAFVLNGVTINAPPFNSMDWRGSLDLVTCIVNDYKQVGSFYGQTDGIELYAGSVLEDVFYHANDDTIKMYYSNVVAKNLVVWKLSVAPVVQFGWAPRNTENVTIDTVDVIHQAYENAASNPGLFGSDNNYEYSKDGLPTNTRTADVTKVTRNITWSNFRSEGPSGCLFRIYALQNLENITIKNVWVESWEPAEMDTTESRLPPFYDVKTGNQVSISNFVISGFTVGNTPVTASNAATVGQVKVDPSYQNSVLYL
ncbi:Isopullulanase [Cladobotryum mycophilum]|uniref:Isopullulanase n=1 Tax=Cladobotryum mycophilum TaxID=491253 RepID=A0ABR0T5D7_9HYPO